MHGSGNSLSVEGKGGVNSWDSATIKFNGELSGDGELTAIQLLNIVKQSGKTLHELASAVTHYPQILLNVPGPVTNADKKALIACPEVQEAVKKGEAMLAGDGRILLRPSGTEALIRVMVEAGTQEKADEVAHMVASIVEIAKKSFQN